MLLSNYVKTLDDNDIIVYVSRYKSTPVWHRNEASNETFEKMFQEWRSRHGMKPIPTVITESEMIFTE